MKATEIAIDLIKFRMTRSGEAMGLSTVEARKQAERAAKNLGLNGFFRSTKAVSGPDGAIAVNVQSYAHILKQNNFIFDGNTEVPPHLNKLAISQIEDYRSKHVEGYVDYPIELGDYNYYRTVVELRQFKGIEPEEMGLDLETVRLMTDMALGYFTRRKAA